MNPIDTTPIDTAQISRRTLGKRVGQIAAASALAGIALPSVYAAGDSTIQVVLVGCGGRGTGAAADALRAKGVHPKLVAMADVFPDRLKNSYSSLTSAKDIAGKIDVPEDRKFIGFDAYKHAVDCLKPGDVTIFTTPLAFRWVHFTYAIEKGVNVFMEKPLTADGVCSKRMLKLGEDAKAKNLKVGVGLMSRHAHHLEELQKRISDGQLGDILLMRGYRMANGNVASFRSPPKPEHMSDLEYQIRRFHSFIWASGGCYNDYNIHIIDHLCWMKNAFPVKAMTAGGRHYKTDDKGVPWVDQNFDSYSTEYTFADGTKLLFDGRCIDGAEPIYSSHIHGTKGSAIAALTGDCNGPSSIYKGFSESKDDKVWQSVDHTNPYQNEWDSLMDAIVNNKPYNEVERGVHASLTGSMGRASGHIGKEVTFEDMLNSEHEFFPGIDEITATSPSPVPSDAKGDYPKPEPGKKSREW
jgi:predicted dehydrogenase